MSRLSQYFEIVEIESLAVYRMESDTPSLLKMTAVKIKGLTVNHSSSDGYVVLAVYVAQCLAIWQL